MTKTDPIDQNPRASLGNAPKMKIMLTQRQDKAGCDEDDDNASWAAWSPDRSALLAFSITEGLSSGGGKSASGRPAPGA